MQKSEKQINCLEDQIDKKKLECSKIKKESLDKTEEIKALKTKFRKMTESHKVIIALIFFNFLFLYSLFFTSIG